jgi:hypothetical protein
MFSALATATMISGVRASPAPRSTEPNTKARTMNAEPPVMICR